MSEILLEDAKIKYEGEWFTADDLTKMIQDKMQAGDMKFANIAATLEELKTALENSHTLDIKLVLSKKDYEKLQTLAGEDDRESIRTAIMAFIGGPSPSAPAKKKLTIKCPKCKSPVEIATDERPLDIECDKCGTGGILTPENKWTKPE